MSVTKQTIKVKLEKHETLEATGITIPFDVEGVEWYEAFVHRGAWF